MTYALVLISVGAFNLLPVARLYLRLPLAVNPPPWIRITSATTNGKVRLIRHYLFAFLLDYGLWKVMQPPLAFRIALTHHFADVFTDGFARTSFS
jgi:hypothetical protein